MAVNGINIGVCEFANCGQKWQLHVAPISLYIF